MSQAKTNLKTIFYELSERYDQRLQEVESIEGHIYTSTTDFLGLEPFYAEQNNIPREVMRFLDPEEEPEGADFLYIHLVKDRRILFKRMICGESISYDSFYSYQGNETLVAQIYVSPGKRSPVGVERLVVDEHGRPTEYQHYTDQMLVTKTYTNTNNHVDVRITHHSYKYQSEDSYGMRVIFNNELSEVDEIYETREGQEESLVYSKAAADTDIEELGQAIADNIVGQIRRQLEQNARITEQATCLLLEYSTQHPFPPTIALGLESELQATLDSGYTMLAFYNAPDLQYFSENDTLNIDLYVDGLESDYNSFNAKYEALGDYLDDDALDDLVFKLYLDICNKLNTLGLSTDTLNQGPGFHVTARDFEACNEARFLEEVLSEEAFRKIQESIEKVEEENRLPEADQAFVRELEADLERAAQRYDELKRFADKNTEKVVYSTRDFYSLKPHHFEMKTHKAPPPTEGQAKEEIGFKPDFPFKEYGYRGEEIIYKIIYFDDREYITYYTREQGTALSHSFSRDKQGGVSFVRYEKLEFEEGRVCRYTEKEQIHQETIDYHWSGGHVVSSDEHILSYHRNTKLERNTSLMYTYHDDGTLFQIINQDRDEPFIHFSSNNDYIAEAGKRAGEHFVDQLMKALTDTKGLNTHISHIILEYNTRSCFPPDVSLATVLEVGKDKSDFIPGHRIAHSSHTDLRLGIDSFDDIYMRFGTYTLIDHTSTEDNNLSTAEAVRFVEEAFHYTCERLAQQDFTGILNVNQPLMVMARAQNQSFEDALATAVSATN